MTDSTAAQPVPAKPASFWEDLIDIFYQPSDVYRRRAHASVWPPFLFVVIAMSIITMTTYPAIAPALEGDYARTVPRMMAQNKNMTQEMADKGQTVQAVAVRYFSGVFVGVSVLIVGFFTWVVGKMFGATETFGAAMLIASYAYVPRVIGGVLSAVQGLLMDPTTLTSAAQLSLSPARFLNPDTASPISVALLSRLDLMVLWETALLAIGLAVLGKISRGKAIGFAITILIVGSLFQLRQAYVIS